MGFVSQFIEVVHVAGALGEIDIDFGVNEGVVGPVFGPRTFWNTGEFDKAPMDGGFIPDAEEVPYGR